MSQGHRESNLFTPDAGCVVIWW